MNLQSNFRTIAAASVVAFVFALGSVGAMAQFEGGPHGGGFDVGHLIAHAKAQLNLNTSQSSMFDAAVAQSKAARPQLQALHQQVKTALTNELAKPEPDLAAVAAAADGARASATTIRNQVRASWLALYATFSPDQKAVIKTMLQNRLARAEAFKQRMLERLQNSQGTTTN